MEKLEKGGPAGIEEAYAVSVILEQPIHIFKQNSEVEIIGKQYINTKPIELSFFEARSSSSNGSGFYVPYGAKRHWISFVSNKNCSLFDAIAHQIDGDSTKLRRVTIAEIRNHPNRYLAPHVEKYFGSKPLLVVDLTTKQKQDEDEFFSLSSE